MIRRRPRLVLLAAVLLGISLFLYRALVPNEGFRAEQPILIATGGKGGVYDQFGHSLSRSVHLKIVPKSTVGSLENLNLLRDRQVDYALVQSDIAQYFYLGERGQRRFGNLALVLPLFPEFVQILLPANSRVQVLADLRGKRVCTGEEGSGTQFNSLDVLGEAGLRASIDFVSVEQRTEQCVRRMIDGDGVDAVFATSNYDYTASDTRLRPLFLSQSALSSLVARHPYFRLERMSPRGPPQPAVDALLVTHSGHPQGNVYAVTRELIRHRAEIGRSLTGGLAGGGRTGDSLIPYHASAQSALVSMGIQKQDYYFFLFLTAWGVLLVLCLASERAKTSYNRLGESTVSDLTYRILVKHIGKVSQAFIGVTALLLFFAAAVYLLLKVEDSYAQQAGVVSPFTAMDFVDSILWLFTYIASGFTADGIYPATMPGKIIVAILAVVGLVAPITAVIFLVNVTNAKAQRHLQGLGRADLRDHLVICGWNEKAPGLIYTVTGKDVDRRLRVVLIAQLEEKYPLEAYNFNPRYVTYCRGDTADAAVLKRAGAEHAGVIIVLADFKASAGHNRKSILTVMNARRVNPKAHICAELEYLDNIDFYQAAGCDSLVYPSLVISRIATVTILSPFILDYVLDVLTYHEFDELRSVVVADLDRPEAVIGRSCWEIEQELVPRGVNLVGVLHGGHAESLRGSLFGEGAQPDALLNAKDRNLPLAASDILVYSAEHGGLAFGAGSTLHGFEPLADQEFGIAYPCRLSILICGDDETIRIIETGLRRVYDDLHLGKVDIARDPLRYIEQINTLAPDRYDKIVVLAPQSRRSEITRLDDLNEIDAELILTTRLLKEAFRRRGFSPQMICEIGNIRNRGLLREAGADIVLPALLATERFLTKEAYDKDHVSHFLMAAMDLDDAVHLHSHTVRMGDGFCGNRYSQILCTPIDGLKLLGWLPASQRDLLTNRDEDYGFHFRTAVDPRLRNLVASEGDVLIMMIEKRSVYRTAVQEAQPAPAAAEQQEGAALR